MGQNNSEAKSVVELTNTLIEVIKNLTAELHTSHLEDTPVTLDSSLDRDLGFDSLAKVELLSRIEESFNVVLSEQVFTEAETPRDLLRAIASADSRKMSMGAVRNANPAPGEVDSLPYQEKTLNEVVKWYANSYPDRIHLKFYSDEGNGESITYKELWINATSIAAGLQYQGIEIGQPIAIMLPTEKDYFFTFFGILLAGSVPVPLYPPARLNQIKDHLSRQSSILNNCKTPILITLPEAKPFAQLLKARVKTLKEVMTVKDLSHQSSSFIELDIGERELAFLQYTSGSTGMPKGVCLTHANLMASIRTMGKAVQMKGNDVVVSWLPLYHDMGLIGAWLTSLYHGILVVIMSPLTFLNRPQRWLWAIHRNHGSISVAPNFAYDLCLKRIDPGLLDGLDLNCWRIALNGAEAVSPNTIQQFSERFAPYGFKKEALMPVYGLAECTLGLTFPPVGRQPVIDKIKRTPFMQLGKAIPEDEADNNPLQFVACGRVLPGHEIRIIDNAGTEVPDRQEGKLQFRGPSASTGYYRNHEHTKELFDGDWLNSGDLAYMSEGDIYLTGRNKDVIIKAGRNIYPHELEETIGNTPGIRKGNVAVFGSKDEKTGTERVVVLAETRLREAQELERLRSEINSLGIDLLGSPPDDTMLLEPGTILKTSSGKIRRGALRELFEKNKLGKSKAVPWMQLISFGLSGLIPQVRRAQKYLTERIYSVYGWLLFAGFFTVIWLLMLIIPGSTGRYKFMHIATRLLIQLGGLSPKVKGLENFPKDKPYIIVSNHCSYIDPVIILASVPFKMRFVAKSELLNNFVMRVLLRRIRTEFVDRFDKQKGIEESQRIVKTVHSDWPLLFFPEGTLTRMTGLLPFHMGAFLAAAESGVCILPIAVKGTRSTLRDESWLLHQVPITVNIGKPITVDSTDNEKQDIWKNAIYLRNESRDFILRYCGEPDLSHEKPPIF